MANPKYSLETLKVAAMDMDGEDDKTPEAIKQLFGGKIDLDMNTEIPDSMIIPQVFMLVIRESMNPDREKAGVTLLEVMRESFNRVMISRNRAGRKETHGIFQSLMQSLNRNSEDEEEAVGR